jgi:predicted nucleic acid-binding protein
MTRFAIDAGTLLEIAGGSRPVSPRHQLVAPHSIRSEAINLLLGRVRSGQLTEVAALRLLERLTQLRVRLLDDRVSRRTAWEIAQERGWATVDLAEYLAVARLQADALIASDPGLAEMAAGVVALAPLSALFAD